jgi:hypothetical protein
MSAPATILFTFRPIPTIVTMCEGRGIDVVALLKEHGIPEEGATGQVTAPLARIQAFLNAVARRLEAPLLGLDLADGSGLSEPVIASRLGFANARTMRRSLDEGDAEGDTE